jgi:hypothetical protein
LEKTNVLTKIRKNNFNRKNNFMEQFGKLVLAVVVGMLVLRFLEHHWKSGEGKKHHYDGNEYDPSTSMYDPSING